MDPAVTRRRIKAARALAGYSVGELAAAINESGMGERILRAIEAGENDRVPRRMELRAIADACEVPFAFFEVANFDALEETGDSPAPPWAQDMAQTVDLILAEILSRSGAGQDEHTEEAAA